MEQPPRVGLWSDTRWSCACDGGRPCMSCVGFRTWLKISSVLLTPHEKKKSRRPPAEPRELQLPASGSHVSHKSFLPVAGRATLIAVAGFRQSRLIAVAGFRQSRYTHIHNERNETAMFVKIRSKANFDVLVRSCCNNCLSLVRRCCNNCLSFQIRSKANFEILFRSCWNKIES